MKQLAIAFLSLLSVAAFADSADEAAIKKANDTFVQAWNAHDPKAMASIWTKDGDLINPMGRVAKGQDEVEKLFTDEQGTMMKKTTAKMDVTDIKMIDKDAAVVDHDMMIKGMMGPDGKAMPDMKLHVTTVMKKEGNDWKIASGRPYAFVPSAPGKAGKMKKGSK